MTTPEPASAGGEVAAGAGRIRTILETAAVVVVLTLRR